MSILLRRHNLMAANDTTPTHDYPNEYLTTEALEAGIITFTIPAGVPTTGYVTVSGKKRNRGYVNYVEYSTDGGVSWNRTTNVKSTAFTIDVPVNKGTVVLWRGNAYQYRADASNYCMFSSSCEFIVYGNIMSMLYSGSFNNATTFRSLEAPNEFQFYKFFTNCSTLINASNLVLPATTLNNGCYHSMFRGCTHLTTGPDLLANSLVTNCYIQMFYMCNSLTSIRMKATTSITISAGYTDDWVYNVSNSGTFYKKRDIFIPTGAYGIPTGWTVVEED